MCELFLLDSDSEGPKVQIHLHMNDCMRNNFGYLVVSACREHPKAWSVGSKLMWPEFLECWHFSFP